MLCHCVSSANRARYESQLNQMFRQRHKVFAEHMGWKELVRPDGLDIDEYDTDDSVYQLVLDDDGVVVASNRMNPLWGRHQLEPGSVLHRQFVMREPPRGANVWEGSRFLPGFPNRYGAEFARATMGILLAGIQEFCLRRAATIGISIMETSVTSKTRSLGWDSEPLGLPVTYETSKGLGEGTAVAWRAGIKYLAKTREAFGIRGPVLYEAPPVVDAADGADVSFELLDRVAALRSLDAQRQALATVSELLRSESGPSPVKKRAS